jgi:hypothetical protein
MELSDFIALLPTHRWDSTSVICFTGQAYPLLFFSRLRAYLKDKHQCSHPSLSENAIHHLSISSVVTERSFYWVSSFEELTKKEQKELCAFLAHYAGPHTVVLFIPEDLATFIHKNWMIITIPTVCDKNLFMLLTQWCVGEAKNNKEYDQLRAVLFKQKNTLSVDDALLLIYYQSVMGKNISLFITQWLPCIINPSTSLFGLSQSLFACDPQFWKQWYAVANQFSPQFWITFWSEQLWRASMYISARKEGRDTKMISAKLPFSFINRDWRAYTCEELSNAHNYIYTLDYNLKQGATDYGFDLFYTKFFLGSFKHV